MFNPLPKYALMALFAFSALAVIVFLSSDVLRVVDAQEDGSSEVGFTLVAFDTSLSDLDDIEAADLAAKMVLSNADEGLILVGLYSDNAEEPEVFASGDHAKEAVNDAISGLKSRVGEDTVAADLSAMLEGYASFVEQLGQSGKIFVLSAGRFTLLESSGVGGLESMAADLASRGVTVNAISLATTPAEDRQVLAAVSSAGGGRAYDLGFPDGVLEFINGELGVALMPSLQTDAMGTAGESIEVEVPPHSAYLVAGFAFEDSGTVNVIMQPNGQEIRDTGGSVNTVSISDTTFFTVRNPQPGVWGLHSVGGSGALTMYSGVVNDLSVVLDVQPPFPVGEPSVLTATAWSGELPLVDASALIDAVVTGPDGFEQAYVLNDLGEDGDVFSEDGVFSGTVGGYEATGVGEVELSMRWPDVSATIEAVGAFLVEPFPTIEILAVGEGAVDEGARAHLATVDLKFNDAAFLAAEDEIEVSVERVADGSVLEIELEPTEVVDDKVYQLRVFGVLPEGGEYEFAAVLRSNHLGRDFVAESVGVRHEFELIVPAPIMLYAGVVLAASVGFLFLMLVVRTLLRSGPYGYLYRVSSSGERELVANFRDYRHSFWDWLMNRPIVPIAALPAVPLHGGRFTFERRGISFMYRGDRDGVLNVRVRGDSLREGDTMISDDEEFQIGRETFVFDRSRPDSDVRVSERLKVSERLSHEDLENFALDPMTWDAPPSARPTRRHRRKD